MENGTELTPDMAYHTVRSWLRKQPDLLSAVITGVTDGVQQAIDDTYAARAKTDIAFRVALSMISNKRLLKDENFVQTVINGMPLTGRSGIEAEFARRYGPQPAEAPAVIPQGDTGVERR